MTVVPAFCFAESSSLCANLVVTLYDALGAIAVYVRTGSLYTSDKV